VTALRTTALLERAGGAGSEDHPSGKPEPNTNPFNEV
jgi:hypothetical protein